MDGSQPTVASLFAGCGGFDLGFKSEGFRPVAAFDIDPIAVDTFNANIVNVATVCDLSDTTPPISADVLLAGSPCQGFSTAGKRALEDPRNNLLVRAGEIALTIRPKVFVLENVPAAISGRHGSRWEQVEAMLRAGGYMVERIVVHGQASGVPQLRKRLFLLAWRGDTPVRCDLTPRASPSLMQTINGISGATGHDPLPFKQGSREALIAARIGPGQKLCNVRISPAAVHTWHIPEVFGAITASETAVLEAIVRLRRRDRRRDFGDADPVKIERICSHLARCCHSEVEHLLSLDYSRANMYAQATAEIQKNYASIRFSTVQQSTGGEMAAANMGTMFGYIAGLFDPETGQRSMEFAEAARQQALQKLDDAARGGVTVSIEGWNTGLPDPAALQNANACDLPASLVASQPSSEG